MNNIELTQNHKNKILEICKKLFPEYKFEFPNNFSEWGVIKINKIGQHEIFENVHHWFEFCMMHLSKKMLTSNNGESDYDEYILFSDNVIYGKHPVDYLYKEFLKLQDEQ